MACGDRILAIESRTSMMNVHDDIFIQTSRKRRFVNFSWRGFSLLSFFVVFAVFVIVGDFPKGVVCNVQSGDYSVYSLHHCMFPGMSFVEDTEMKGIDHVRESNDSASLVNLFRSKMMKEPKGFKRMANIAVLTWNIQFEFPNPFQIKQMLNGYGDTIPDVLVIVLQESWKRTHYGLSQFVLTLASELSSMTGEKWEPLQNNEKGTPTGGVNLSNFLGTCMGWNTQTVIALKRTSVRVSEVKLCQSTITKERGFVGVSFMLHDNNNNFLGYHFHGGLHLGISLDDQETQISHVLKNIGLKCASKQVLQERGNPKGLDVFDFVSLAGDYNARVGLCDLVSSAKPNSKLEYLVKPIFRSRFKKFFTQFWQMVQSVRTHWPGIKKIFDFEEDLEKNNVSECRLSMYSLNQQLWFLCLFTIFLHQENTEEDIALRWLMNGNVGASVSNRSRSVLKILRDDYNFIGSGSCPSGGFSYKYDKKKFQKSQMNSELTTYEFMLYYLNFPKLVRTKITDKIAADLSSYLNNNGGCRLMAHIGVLDYIAIRQGGVPQNLLYNTTVISANPLNMVIDRQWQVLNAFSDHLPLMSSLQVGYHNMFSKIT